MYVRGTGGVKVDAVGDEECRCGREDINTFSHCYIVVVVLDNLVAGTILPYICCPLEDFIHQYHDSKHF